MCETVEEFAAKVEAKRMATEADFLLAEVYEHVGNHRPPSVRHAVPPGVRDRIRDYLAARGYFVTPATTSTDEAEI
jgi:hypothetical protein